MRMGLTAIEVARAGTRASTRAPSTAQARTRRAQYWPLRVQPVALLLALGWLASTASAQDGAANQVPGSVSPAALAQQNATGLRLPVLGGDEDWNPVGPRKDYLLPALEIIGFDAALNRVNHTLIKNTTDYDISVGSWRRNLRSSWVTDSDPFSTNQFAHPYQGAMYHGFARSAGMNYWEAAAYTFAGNAFWEVFGEITPPSRNDQIASGVAGRFLGESLFRMASLVLEKESKMSPF